MHSIRFNNSYFQRKMVRNKMKNYYNQIFYYFPKKLLESGYSLEDIGINEIAWNYQDIKEVITFLINKGCYILEIDIYSINDEENIEITSDKLMVKTNKDNIKQIINCIDEYVKKNGQNHLYSIVFEIN